MPEKSRNKSVFTLLYLKSVAVDYYEQLDEKKLLDYMNRSQKRKSIVDRMDQVQLVVDEEALILSKPMWWSSSGSTSLPYTQLREAYVFGKDNKRIAIDIMSIDSGLRRVLLFKARSLDEREELIELLQKRKMSKEMYEKDNIHPVQYANWSSTYADDTGKLSFSQPVSNSPNSSRSSSPPAMKRVEGLSREVYDPVIDDSLHENDRNKQLAIVPMTQHAIVEKPMREVTIQAGWGDGRSSAITPYYTPSPMNRWNDGEDWRRNQQQQPCSHNHDGQCHQHNSIHIVINGKDVSGGSKNDSVASVSTKSSSNVQENRSQNVKSSPIVELCQSPPYYKSETPRDMCSSKQNSSRMMLNETETARAHNGDGSLNIYRYPSQTDMRSVESVTLKNRTYSQPDVSTKPGGGVRSVNWDTTTLNNIIDTTHNSNTTTYRVIDTHIPKLLSPSADKTGGHTYHTTLVTKAGTTNVMPVRDLATTPSRTTKFRDECFEERIATTVHRTSDSNPQTSRLAHNFTVTGANDLSDAHHGWMKETKFYEIRNNKLAKVNANGSRYAVVSMQPSL